MERIDREEKDKYSHEMRNRRAAIVDALNKTIEIFTSHDEKTFEDVMAKGIKPVAVAVGLDRVVFYRRLDIDGHIRFGQIYRWDRAEGGLTSLDDELRALPDIPVLSRWISILLEGGCVRIRKSEMAEDEWAFLSVFGIKSLLLLPVFTHGELWGGVALQDHTNDRYFDEGCADLLHSAVRLFANTIERAEVTQSAEKAMKTLKRRKKMTDTVNKAAVLFLSRTEETFEETMTAGVGLVVDVVNVDRVSIWRNFTMKDGLHTSQIYRWDRESGGTTAPTPGLEDVTYARLAPRWEKMLAGNRMVNSPVHLLPEAAMLQSFGVISALVIPIFFSNAFWGFMLFEDRKEERYFDEESIEMMRSATLLCANTVIRAEMERRVTEANERTKLMLDTIPISCQWWDKDLNIIDCNNAAVKLFGLKDKQEFFEKFFTLMPEYQPDGRRSDEKAISIVKKAFEDGSYGIEWMHRMVDGTLMPAEVNLERMKFKDEDPILLGYVRDLRKQKQLISDIEQANEFNQATLDAAPFGISMFDENLNLFDCNDAAPKLFGYDKKYYIEHFFEFSPEYQEDGQKSSEKAVSLIKKALDGENQVLEWIHYSKSGELTPCEVTLTRVRFKGKYIVLGYQYDLRNIKTMEQKARYASELNRAMIDAAPIGITVFDKDMRFFDCNDAIVSAYGGTKEQFISNFLDFSPEYQDDGSNSREKINEIMKKTFAGERQVYEWTHRSITGELLPFEITTTRVKHYDEYIGIAFQYNLSNIKKMEKDIAEAEEMTHAIIEASPVSYMLFDENFRPMDCNDVLLKTVGCSDKQYFLEHYWDTFVPESQTDENNSFKRANALGKKVALNEKLTLEWLQRSMAGELIPMENTLKHIIYKGNKFFITFKYDLRNIKKMMESIREQGELLKDALNKATMASKAKGEFLSNMSHEIRTPLNAITGMTMIGKNSTDLEQKNYALDKIGEASTHLLGVINDVLDMSKIEENKLVLSPVEFDFEKMLQRVVAVITFRVEEKHQQLTVHIDQTIPKNLIGDDQRLAQIITNLLANSVKFTDEKGSIRLDARLLGEEGGVCTIQITVDDTGIGISSEQQTKLFQSFQQAESSTARKYGGTGLGLSISKNIVEMMGGNIQVRSDLGKGSTFTFTIQAMRGRGKKQGLLSKDINWNNVRIMAIDDDPDILAYFKEIMQGFGVSCDTAINGEEALRLVERNGSYNIYFVDWKMPGINGIQLTGALKAKVQNPGMTVVIMISAAEWSEIEEEAKKAGVDRFLSKPLFPSTIMDIVNETFGVGQHQQEEEKEEDSDITGLFAGHRILLAEDVEINREIVIGLFAPTQLEIDCAENGVEAVSIFSKAPEKYDLIFMDVQMPEMDGYEATRRIRALDFEKAKTVPIIAMTANVFREDIDKCLEAGMNDHAGKPLDFNEVLGKLRGYLLH